jgi:hypothetical protein
VAFFRSEAAALLHDSSSDATSSRQDGGLVLSGLVTQVSYPGGTWRHTIEVGDHLFYVDAPVRHTPGARVRIRLDPKATFLFPTEETPGKVGEEMTESRRTWADRRTA